MIDDPLASAVRQLFVDLRHAGTPDLSPALQAGIQRLAGEAGREQRGTRVRFVVTRTAEAISTARFAAYGCPHTLAACEWLCRELEAGRQGSIGGPSDWCRTLGIPIVKLGRLLVVEDALNAAMQHISVR
ncbi:MAG TPA: hypothetical protein VHZ99_01895 [Steroidobacteraceae bacterium]|jgi:hypothetical protein|nr:hypothetical protein [Steroidobacteraceae bacterium]